jgi:hypothetical protein
MADHFGGSGPLIEYGLMVGLKAVGAAAGTIMSLAIIMPETKLEAARRACVSMLAGILFGSPLRRWMEWNGHEGEIAGAAVVAIFGWFVIGMLARTTASWRTVQDARRDIQGPQS